MLIPNLEPYIMLSKFILEISQPYNVTIICNKKTSLQISCTYKCETLLEFGFSLTHHQKLAQEVRIAPLKGKYMKAYLGEHLQGTTTKGHEPEVTVVKKSGTSSGEVHLGFV